MGRFLRALVPTVLALSVAIPCFAQKVPSEAWMGIYVGKMKLGWSRFYADKCEFEGKPAYRLESSSHIKAPVLGTEVEQKIEMTVYLGSAFEPVYETFKTSSAGYSMNVTARFKPTEIVAETDSEGKKTTKTIPIPPGSKLFVEDSSFLSQTMKLKVGDKRSFKSFNPLTLTLDDIEIEVLRDEDIMMDGERHSCQVIKSTTPLGDATSWQKVGGDLLKIETSMGITMVREPKGVAQSLESASGEYVPSSDFAVLTSAKTKTKIAQPREVKYLKIRLIGFDDKTAVISDSRQKATFHKGDPNVAEYVITASDFDPSKAVSLPMNTAGMDEFLAPSQYIEPDDPEIKSASEQIVGNEKNAFRAASRIRDWVETNVQTKGDIGLIRNSTDILRSRSGVCRDYAVLYAALARAAGIPTKIVAGMMYFREGFYYHAWAESFVGEWIPMDPTLSTDFVDATHIKLNEGDALAMFKAVKAVGKLKAEVVEFK